MITLFNFIFLAFWPETCKLLFGNWKLFIIYSCYLWLVLWGRISISLLFFILTACTRDQLKLACELGLGFKFVIYVCIHYELGSILVRVYCSELLLTVGGCTKAKVIENIWTWWYLKRSRIHFPTKCRFLLYKIHLVFS